MSHKTIPNRLFNDLLNQESQIVAEFYQENTHYEPHEYLVAIGNDPLGNLIRVVREVNPGDHDLLHFLREAGARMAIDHDELDPQVIFVVQASLGLRVDQPGSVPQRVITIYGISNDARYNLAVLPAQYDEDSRLYALPSDIFHWGGEPDKLRLDVMPYLEFFRVHQEIRTTIPARSGAV